MKKTLIVLGTFLAITTLPASAGAQTLTRAEVQATVPQLSNALSALSSTTSYIRLRMETEDKLFSAYSKLLAAWSVRLAQGHPLSQQEARDLSGSLQNMNEQLSISASWRSEVKTRTNAISSILSNLGSLIASAR